MRSTAVVLAVCLGVLFAGGYFSILGQPVFAHIDDIVGSSFLMTLHRGVFFFLYSKGKAAISAPAGSVDEFQRRPLGIDNKGKYRQLDDASRN
jgi:hypothetical protein